MVGERRLADMEQGGEVRVPRKDISEPSFDFGHGGDREFVLPGNREYVAGDRIPRPEGACGDGGGRRRRRRGDGDDAFVFSLSREEFMQIFFDDLELPNLARTEIGRTDRQKSMRAGFTTTGVPANLAIVAHAARGRWRDGLRCAAAWRRRRARPKPNSRWRSRPGRQRDAYALDVELERLQAAARGASLSGRSRICAIATGCSGASRWRARSCSA